MYTKFISKNIQEKLKEKERALAWKSPAANENNTDASPSDFMTRSVFLRMCSNKVDVDNILISGGEYDADGQMQFGSSMYKLGKSGLRPMAGIKDISVEYKGGFKAIREATINWTIFSIEDLDRLTPYFLTVGKTVALDWGWVYSKTKSLTEQLGSEPFITKDANNKFQVNQEIFTNSLELIIKKGGEYDAIGGQVRNFNYTLREDGGFDCTTIITAMGAALFTKPINSNTNKLNIVKQKNSEGEDKAIYTPPDSLINGVINLRDIVIYEVFGANYYKNTLTYSKHQKEAKEGRDVLSANVTRKKLDHNAIFLEDYIGGGYRGSAPTPEERATFEGAVWKDGKFNIRADADESFGIAVDNPALPNVILTSQPGFKEDIFVTWGWFEDFFLSRYTSLIGGRDDVSADNAKLTFRSIDTVSDENGIPLRWKEYQDLVKDDEESLTETFINDSYGYELREIAKNWNASELTEVVKAPSLIRNVPLLYPVDPFKFFTTDTLIKEGNVANFGQNKDDGFLDSVGSFFTFWVNEDSVKGKRHAKFIKQLFGGGFQILQNPNRKFAAIRNPTKKGRLRNIWVNIKEIQKAFGISNPSAKNFGDDNVKPTGTLERAVTILLNSLNDNFHNIWDFEIVTDIFDSTNVKITDKGVDEMDDPKYTTYEQNSHKVQDRGIYRFPSYKIGSFVKNQSLEFKITNAQSLTTMYGSNAKKGSSFTETNNPSLIKLFGNDDDKVFNDKFLVDAKPVYIDLSEDESKNFIFKPVRVGSKEINQNAKIKIGETGITINPKKSWWNVWTPGISYDDEPGEEEAAGKKKVIEKFTVRMKDGKQEIFWVKEESAGSGKFSYGSEVPFYKYSEDDEENKSGTLQLLPDAAYALDSYYNSATPLAQFDMNSLIPAELGLEIDGIGGLLPGDIVHTDYIQERYKTEISTFTYTGRTTNEDDVVGPTRERTPVVNRGPLTYFQVINITQKVSGDGWNTELQTKMRINAFPKGEEIDFDKIPKNTPTKALEKSPDPIIYDEENEDTDPRLSEKAVPPQKLRRAKQVTIPPENVDPPFDPSVPLIPIELMSEEDFNNPTLLGKTVTGNDTDTSYVTPDPPGSGIARFPGFGKFYKQPQFQLNRPAVSTLSAPPQEIVTKTIIAADPSPPLQKPAVGKVVQATVAYTDVVEVRDWEEPTLVVEQIKKAIEVQPKPAETIPITIVQPQEIQILQSTYDPSIKDYTINPTFQLIYKIVPGWYTKSPNNPKNTSFYGEGPTDAVLTKYRQKFWDEIIEAPNETGKTNLDTTEKIRQKLEDIGDTYKDLDPYDTWTPITGIPYAMYPSYDETKNGTKIVLPSE